MEPGVSDFLRQIPLSLIVMFCGSALALLAALSFIVSARSRRARAAVTGTSAALYSPPVNYSTESSGMDSELPDLDALVTGELPAVEAPPKRQARTGTFSVRLADGDTLEAVEVLTVLRDVVDGGILIQIGDKVYRNPPALADAEFKRRFNTVVGELARNVSVAPPRTGTVPPVGMMMPAAQDIAENASSDYEMPTDADLLPPVNKMTTPPPRATGTTPAAAPGDLPKFTLPQTPLQAKPLRRVPKPTGDPIPEINVGGSVESYLQYKLEQSEEFAGRSIHIRPNPKGDLVIEVDGKFYDSISEVEDVLAQAFLRAAIEEWQSRQ